MSSLSLTMRQRFGRYPIRRIRCPKCRKPPMDLIETSEAFSSYAVRADGKYRDAEGYHSHGDVVSLHAKCECGHRWRVRGAIQVTDLDTGPEVES